MDQEFPISLYFDLEDGLVADLETVANAAILWSRIIKETAFIIDPTMELRVELASGTKGSLSLNSLLKVLGKTKKDRRKVIIAVLLAVSGFFANETGSFFYQKWLAENFSGQTQSTQDDQLSAQDIIEIREIIEKNNVHKIAKSERQAFFKVVNSDPAIVGVGITRGPGERPTSIVPRREFQFYSGEAETTLNTIEEFTADGSQREKEETIKLTLVSPVLLAKPRSWRFQSSSVPEFSAKMNDVQFLQAMAEGNIAIPLKAGVEMTVVLVTKEEFDGGVWVPKSRAVSKVLIPSQIDTGLFGSRLR